MQNKKVTKKTTLAIMVGTMVALASCNGGNTTKATSEKDSSTTVNVDTSKTKAFVYDKSFTDKFTHHTAIANGVKYHYVMGGKGDVILLIHGYPETWHTWYKLMPALAENHTVIAVDMRGMGETQITDTGYHKRTVAEDIHQLMEGLGIKKFNLVAHDWGSSVAYSLANAYPETVTKLVMAEAPVPGYGFDAAMDVAHGGQWHFGFFMSKYAEMLTAGKEREFLTQWAFRDAEVFQKDSIKQDDIDVYVASYTKPGGMTAGFNYYRTALEDSKYNVEHMKKLTMPVLAIGGANSLGIYVAASLKQVANNVQGEVIKDCGHFITEEQPTAFTKLVLDFLNKK